MYPKRAKADVGYTRSIFVGDEIDGTRTPRQEDREGLQQATARFEDTEITTVLADEGLIYGSLPHLCRLLSLDVPAQQERIEEHAVLEEGLIDFDLVISGRVLTTACLKSSLIPLWLALVPVKHPKVEKQERVLLFQRR